MMKHTRLSHRFVQYVPETLEPGVLYISLDYGTVAHSCCCGCGEEVVTPLTPTDWWIIFDGESVSLRPSVGSWTLPCRSHYVITRGHVVEAGRWSVEEIENERRRDRLAKSAYYNNLGSAWVSENRLRRRPTLPNWARNVLFAIGCAFGGCENDRSSR